MTALFSKIAQDFAKFLKIVFIYDLFASFKPADNQIMESISLDPKYQTPPKSFDPKTSDEHPWMSHIQVLPLAIFYGSIYK